MQVLKFLTILWKKETVLDVQLTDILKKNLYSSGLLLTMRVFLYRKLLRNFKKNLKKIKK